MTPALQALTDQVVARHRRPNTSGRVGEPFVSGEATPRYPLGICSNCANVIEIETGVGHDVTRHRASVAR
jgi:hypothetical protein